MMNERSAFEIPVLCGIAPVSEHSSISLTVAFQSPCSYQYLGIRSRLCSYLLAFVRRRAGARPFFVPPAIRDAHSSSAHHLVYSCVIALAPSNTALCLLSGATVPSSASLPHQTLSAIRSSAAHPWCALQMRCARSSRCYACRTRSCHGPPSQPSRTSTAMEPAHASAALQTPTTPAAAALVSQLHSRRRSGR